MVSLPSRTQAPYGRRAVEVLGSVPSTDHPPTYYERPAVKPTEWRWLIVSYLFVGGLAGAAQVVAGVVDLLDHERDRPLISTGRYVALAGALVSPMLLIADLKTPERWYNMLRIFRWTSPLSIGSWTLFLFGGFSGFAAFAQALDDIFGVRPMRLVARLVGIPAAILGAILATYTGSLLSATSTPLWAAGYRLLPALFGTSGASTATATLSLLLRRSNAPSGSVRRLERLALVASMLELLLSLRLDFVWKQKEVDAPLSSSPLALPYRGGALGLGVLVPLAVRLLQLVTGRDLPILSLCASAAALVGGYAQRAVLVFAGKQSAERPVDYFRLNP